MQMNPLDAARYASVRGIESVSRTAGEFTTTAKVFDRVPEGWLGASDHFAQEALQLLTVSSIRTRRSHPSGRRLCR